MSLNLLIKALSSAELMPPPLKARPRLATGASWSSPTMGGECESEKSRGMRDGRFLVKVNMEKREGWLRKTARMKIYLY